MKTVSAIIVNYNAAQFIQNCVGSIFRQRFVNADGTPGEIEVLVLDNRSSEEDRRQLETLPPEVGVVLNDQNAGFAPAVNQAARLTSGRYLLILNPDTALFPGALDALLSVLYRNPRAAMAGPKFYWDDDRSMLLPPVRLPTVFRMLATRWAALSPAFGRIYSRLRNRYALRLWRATAPVPVRMLSGSCLLIRREVVEETGPFDPTFPFYFEDADLCRRVRKAGYQAVYVPAAEVVHYYNQSAQRNAEKVWEWYRASEQRYLEKHYGRVGRAAVRLLASPLLLRPPERAVRYIKLGPLSTPPVFSFPEGTGRSLLFQIALHWLFLDPAGAYPVPPEFTVPPAIWRRLDGREYFARFADPKTLRSLRVWSWSKN